MLTVKNLDFKYNQNEPVIKNISFSVEANKRTCILGESGSGKSTLLKLMYGLLDPEKGEITFNGDEIKGPKYKLIPGHDDMKYVAQDFDLSLFMTVAENVGKHLSNIYLSKKKERVKEILDVLSLSEFANKKPIELSGGQMQRVAIARTLAKMPKMLILDEPFSHLDASLHLSIRQKLIEYCEEKNMGVIFSSHRADDALGYSENLIILKSGEIAQMGKPKEVYQNPKNLYVAKLFGRVNGLNKKEALDLKLKNTTKSKCVIYPHEIEITNNGINATVTHARFMGRGYEITCNCKGTSLILNHPTALRKGTAIQFEIKNYRWVN